VSNLVSLTVSYIVNLPHLTCLWNGCSSGISSGPNESFQVRLHKGRLALHSRKSNFAQFGSTNRVWSKMFLREIVS
jgi:hypothetical protein